MIIILHLCGLQFKTVTAWLQHGYAMVTTWLQQVTTLQHGYNVVTTLLQHG